VALNTISLTLTFTEGVDNVGNIFNQYCTALGQGKNTCISAYILKKKIG
jgi:hypothetical protein